MRLTHISHEEFYQFSKKDEFQSREKSGLRGNPVKIRDGPAAVIGDKHRRMPLSGFRMGRRG